MKNVPCSICGGPTEVVGGRHRPHPGLGSRPWRRCTTPERHDQLRIVRDAHGIARVVPR